MTTTAERDLDEVLADLPCWYWCIVRPDVGPLQRDDWLDPRVWGY